MKAYSEDTLDCKQVAHIYSEWEEPFKQKHGGFVVLKPWAGIYAANNGEHKAHQSGRTMSWAVRSQFKATIQTSKDRLTQG